MLKWFMMRFSKDEKGQGMVEYALILALISVVAIGAVGGVGDKVNSSFEKVSDSLGGDSNVEGDVGGEIPGNEDPFDPSESDIDLTEESVDTMISEGVIPVASARELNYLRESKVQLFGEGTKWEGQYESGLDKEYIQVKNIDLLPFSNFEPIGTSDTIFMGSYDGGGFTISNLSINRPDEDDVGLFGNVRGYLKNVGVVDANVSGNEGVGALVGSMNSEYGLDIVHSIENSNSSGVVKGVNGVGGLVGYVIDSGVNGSNSSAYVEGTSNLGGLIGSINSYDIVIDNNYATGDVKGSHRLGGFVGQVNFARIINNKASGNITPVKNGDIYVGPFGSFAGMSNEGMVNRHSNLGSGKFIIPDDYDGDRTDYAFSNELRLIGREN